MAGFAFGVAELVETAVQPDLLDVLFMVLAHENA